MCALQRDNIICNDGAQAIAVAVKRSVSLQELDLVR
jgi:hypothetical protein